MRNNSSKVFPYNIAFNHLGEQFEARQSELEMPDSETAKGATYVILEARLADPISETLAAVGLDQIIWTAIDSRYAETWRKLTEYILDSALSAGCDYQD